MPSAQSAPAPAGQDRPESKILFQDYFRSMGPRTYAAQVKQASNENHFIVLTEGKRDKKTGELRKIMLFVFSEDFDEFFKMVSKAADFIRANPVSDKVKRSRAKYWAKKDNEGPTSPVAAK